MSAKIMNMIDLNKVPDQDDLPAPGSRDTKQRLLEVLPSVLSYLLPEGKRQGEHYVIGDQYGQPGKSLKVELTGPNAGCWHDFATGEGGDVFHLWANVHRYRLPDEFGQMLGEINDWLGRPQTATKHQDKPVVPVDELGPKTGEWRYHDKSGKLIACVYRYDPPTGKEFRPWDVSTGKARAPTPRPLYNLPNVSKADSIVLVEGEKCADALMEQGITATTAMNGSNAPVEKTDWSPLSGKHVLIWPDHDEPGRLYAEKVAKAITAAGATTVQVLSIPNDKPLKWDAADAVAEGEDIRAWLDQASHDDVYDLEDYSIYESYHHPTPVPVDLIGPRVLVERSMWLIAGPPKVGKSNFILNLLMHAATGEDFLCFTISRPLRVYYIQAELEKPFMDERIHKIVESQPEKLKKGLHNLVFTSRFTFTLDEKGKRTLMRKIKQRFQENPVDLIVLDPFRNLFESGLSSSMSVNDEIRSFILERLEPLIRECHPNAGMIIVHHTNKISSKQLQDDPMVAVSGGGMLLSYPASISVLYRSEENSDEVTMHSDFRYGDGMGKKVFKRNAFTWQQIEETDVRFVRQRWGELNDKEVGRKGRVILEFLLGEALEGRCYSVGGVAKVLANTRGLGSESTIRRLVMMFAAKGYIRFFDNTQATVYGLNATRSTTGYLCVEGMAKQDSVDKNTGEASAGIAYLPTHFLDPKTENIYPLKDGDVHQWVYDELIELA